jgi:hypothetical protein
VKQVTFEQKSSSAPMLADAAPQPLYSLTESAKLHGRNPQHHVTDMLAAILDHRGIM